MVDLPLAPSQPPLFELDPVQPELAELFPAAWMAAEGLVHPDVITRQKALDYIRATDLACISPLVTYILATRLTDPSIEIRAHVIQILAAMLGKFNHCLIAENVRKCLFHFMSEMRTRQIYCLLMTLLRYPDIFESTAKLLNASPYAGTHLIDISVSKRTPIEIRRKALCLIGAVGYIDALPALERMAARLEARVNGQQIMPFAPQSNVEDIDLLPDLRNAIASLRST